jgi:hypothetical protein
VEDPPSSVDPDMNSYWLKGHDVVPSIILSYSYSYSIARWQVHYAWKQEVAFPLCMEAGDGKITIHAL